MLRNHKGFIEFILFKYHYKLNMAYILKQKLDKYWIVGSFELKIIKNR